MTEFRPTDGAIFFAWRNTFARINERTYDWEYRRVDIVHNGEYEAQEIPMQRGPLIEYIRLVHERIFSNIDSVDRYCRVMSKRYQEEHGTVPASVNVVAAHHKSPHPSVMYYDNGNLVVPARSSLDSHEDPTGEPEVRDRFIASRWTDIPRYWPLAEHHVLHELAHHISGSEDHGSDFTETFGNLLEIASKGKNFTPQIWDMEMSSANMLLEAGEPVVDMMTGSMYDATGERVSEGAFA